MKNIFINIIILTAATVVTFSGCGEEKKKEARIVTQNNTIDTSSVVINYLVTGAGNGKITITKKGGNVKLVLERVSDGQSNIETRFIADGWIYFYFVTETTVQPVKTKISKDHLYFKNFASLSDAEEIISRTKKNGNEIIAGFTCDIYENYDGSKFSIYNGKYVLQASFDGIIVTATSVSFNVPLQNKDVEKPGAVDFLELTVGPQ